MMAVRCWLLCFLPFALALTASKLSIHSGPNCGTATSSFLHEGQPMLIKLLDNFKVATEYKKIVPGIQVIGRIYLANQPQNGDPKQQAQNWWSKVKQTILSNPDVDYWEGYNEPGNLQGAAMQWYAQFEVERMQILHSNGRKAVIGCFATGTPDVTNQTTLSYFNPAVKMAINTQSLLSVHEYGYPHMQTGYPWFCGRYRKWYNYLNQTHVGLGATKMVVTECGISNGKDGWKGDVSPQQYTAELEWYDHVLRNDSYMLGATIFLIDGTADWRVKLINGPVANMVATYMHGQH
eukprot:TRINITY_DN55110_c0_g1_i1.p1 TRINITY_DN55110_c0_g1~~TRINITY_DN55110_c0_g1_i1.p1  ORF type:complete len:293 (+),score=11.06 TRINITY_DN55110_c0_g1_i1:18-896(+)